MKKIAASTACLAALLLSSIAAQATELTPGQTEVAGRVLVGEAECELKQTVRLLPIDGKPGHFELTFKKLRFTLVPEETSTGAVRLEDRASGVVWIQIPTKSMLLNAKLGRRMVDGCVTAAQRAGAASAPSDSFGLSEASK